MAGEQAGGFGGDLSKITVVGATEFRALIPQLAEPLRDAYKRPPRGEDYTIPEPAGYLEELAEKPGFGAYVATGPNGDPIGALMVDTPGLDEFGNRWGDVGLRLAEFVAASMEQQNPPAEKVMAVICVNEFFSSVRGVATRMASTLVNSVESGYPNGAVLLARIRADDVVVRGLARAFGGKEIEAVGMPSKRGAPLSFWHLVVPARS